ncbi:putative knottin, scorpion toxin [Medicago truncatula]|uniref:Defensin-like protein n=1 Tax=Medicago truncatula TaxID=3880 RepID=A0A072TLM6_MEDTR|nr:Defensin-like protein [Medicago truncatula]RHN39031.1 putative knottin, scorpion toxin [Medicago truncatula]
MISSTSKLCTVFMFICLVVLLISTSEAGDKICKVMHHTKSEFGCVKSACNEVCINIEHATYGYCVPPIPYFSFCFCYLKC